jgi:poly(beta-D-mannuronate) lyase
VGVNALKTFAMLIGLSVGCSAPAAQASILNPSGNSQSCSSFSAPYPGPLPEEISISNNYRETYLSDFDNYMHAYAIHLTAMSSQAVVSDQAADKLRAEIVSNAQRKPIKYNVSANTPPIFHVLLVTVPQALAYARDKSRYAPDEQIVVEAWLLKVINDLQKDYALRKFKLDNKQYLFGVLMAAYGHAAGDKQMLNKAFKTYTTAIKGQRKDGSLPRDSGRGGSALHYSNQAVGNLVALADVLVTAGIDAWGYQSGDKSIHSIIKFLLDATENPALIAGYANDPEMKDASFPGTSPTNQDRSWPNREMASWGHYYLKKFGRNENAARLFALSPFLSSGQIGQPDGPYGNARCYAG